MSSASRSAERYKWIVGVAGLVLLLILTPFAGVLDGRAFVFFATLATLGECLLIKLPNQGGRISITFAVLLPSFVLFGPVVAAWINVIASLTSNSLLHRRPLSVIVFNMGQYVVCMIAASGAYLAFGGSFGALPAVPSAAAFVLTYFVTNHLLVNTYFSILLKDKYGPLQWLESIKWDGLNHAMTIPLSVLMLVLYIERGIFASAVVFLSVLAIAYILRIQMELALANQELAALYYAAQELNSSLDVGRVFSVMLETMRRLMDFHTCALLLWDEQRKELNAVMVHNPTEELNECCTFSLADGVLGSVAERKRAQILDDISTDPQNPWKETPGSGLKSLLVVPLIVEDHLVGELVVGSTGKGEFTREHLRLSTILASQAAIAIENAILYSRTEQMAITDPMTGLHNYRFFYMKLSDELRKAKRSETPLSVIYLDLDDFKKYNDAYGHVVGDEILREFAEILSEAVRDCDVAARYGGDEFVVLLAGTDLQGAEHVAARIKSTVESHGFIRDHVAGPVSLSISVGVASYPEHGSTENLLIAYADRAMYEMKKAAS
ncbi:MAG: sensor domain-containing diguanylate cyclase [Bacillota bacterium]